MAKNRGNDRYKEMLHEDEEWNKLDKKSSKKKKDAYCKGHKKNDTAKLR